MYESYWQLSRKPFESGWDPNFYYPSEVHQGALLKLRYGIESQVGGLVLAGAAGLGKTLLLEALRRQLPERISPVVHIVFSQLPADQLVAAVADELDPTASAEPATLQQSARRISKVLVENVRQGRHAVLVVDDAQLVVKADTLEALRLLLNFHHDGQPAATLLLVGQPSLLTRLDRMPALEQRMGVKCMLRPFSLEETISYVTHRLTAAGAARPIFANEALEALHHLTHGSPRAINRLGDLALLIAYAEGLPAISASHVESVCQELLTVSAE